MGWNELIQQAQTDLLTIKTNQQKIYNKLKLLEEQEKQILMILAEHIKYDEQYFDKKKQVEEIIYNLPDEKNE